jgi:hypothetical protein
MSTPLIPPPGSPQALAWYGNFGDRGLEKAPKFNNKMIMILSIPIEISIRDADLDRFNNLPRMGL